MPIIPNGDGPFPNWCVVEGFEIVSLPEGGSHTFPRRGQREKLIVARGSCRLVTPFDQPLDEHTIADLDTPSAPPLAMPSLERSSSVLQAIVAKRLAALASSPLTGSRTRTMPETR